MISTLKGLLHSPGRAKRVYFYWTTRDSCSFQLFAKQMDRLYEIDTDNMLVIRHFLTSGKAADGEDPSCVLFQNAVAEIYSKTHHDVRLGHRASKPLGIGRPDWANEIGDIMDDAWSRGIEHTGLFLCGAEAMARHLQTTCVQMSQTHKGHIYFTKETF